MLFAFAMMASDDDCVSNKQNGKTRDQKRQNALCVSVAMLATQLLRTGSQTKASQHRGQFGHRRPGKPTNLAASATNVTTRLCLRASMQTAMFLFTISPLRP